MWRWWRKRKTVMTKNLTGLSVLTDEHLESLAESYLQQEFGDIKLKDQIPFSVYVEVERKIKWEV
ncbi:hypothetical protein [Paenibacillus sp. EKM211P]|uniref:hypothetical protein n=1 Tax=Paenibacillus sp. EKM211P TaxID=1683679 RepID=UPI0013E98F1B|nr:hypothetical protein [Paenibacillus sp. EKM211P]KAF6584952.1 hypothetical protein G9G57_07265 [Paenibacillus sp. EKM211P]